MFRYDRDREGRDNWETSGDGPLCLPGDVDDEDCATTSSVDVRPVTTVDYRTTSSRRTTSTSTSTSTVTSRPVTTRSTPFITTSTTDLVSRLPTLRPEHVIYQVVGTTRPPAWDVPSSVSDAPVQSVDPVPMNIGLIIGVAIAIAVLLCMLAYVVYKCVVAGQRPGVAAAGEKVALGHDMSPPHHDPSQYHHHHHAPPPQFAVNGRPPPLLTNDSLTKKDVKEWYVWQFQTLAPPSCFSKIWSRSYFTCTTARSTCDVLLSSSGLGRVYRCDSRPAGLGVRCIVVAPSQNTLIASYLVYTGVV